MTVSFLSHWKAGVKPPLTGLAVNVTVVPKHGVALDAVAVTVAGMITMGVRFKLIDGPVPQELI